MSWNHLDIGSGSDRWGEFELPAAQIAGDLAHHEEFFESVLRRRAASADADLWGPVEKTALVRVRRDQATLSVYERQAFREAVQALVDEGTYDALVRLRGDLSHNMLGWLGVKGLHRFLPWHRRYLWEFETHLARVDRLLRPGQLPLALPYWNWPDPFPDWLFGFLPAMKPAAKANKRRAFAGGSSCSGNKLARAGRRPARRSLSGCDLKPTSEDVRLILHGFRQQLPGAGVGDFVKFTYGLEGWGERPDGSRLPAHNQVHAWVGGVMGDLRVAPTDPVYWLHLAQVDRLWSLWQAEHPGCKPALVGADQVLDPWPETADDVASPIALGYVYDL